MPQPGHLSRRDLLRFTGCAAAAVGLGVGATGCTGGDGDVAILPADQVVLGVSASPGFAPTIWWPLQSPSLVAYGSGRILRTVPSTGQRAIPLAYVEATADPREVARLVTDAEGRRLLDRDFGSPQVTDLGSTRVWLHGIGELREASIYAFAESFDEYLSWRQRRNRRRLRDVLDEATGLVGDADRAFVPQQVVVLELRADESGDPATTRWPGSTPESFLHKPTGYARGAIACGQLTGAPATRVYAAARQNPEQRWLVGATTRVLAVNPLPIEIDC